ncbi:PREDICTED: lysophosphatidic acid phosphatase type 6-like isoform X1 [Branchiostoma belcheri]|uniref:Lysophosphatidic acid phosphatase type 6-like isoform X1 n=1 Tax=Branchiostoma belcheri TaxID=7741 RepID=A0A6P4Y0N7_BRABE|nr:PREDICTED: lysophosphatidic acid phosphatase type 6-like isoform X1 [Branchiostoma belcheri]
MFLWRKIGVVGSGLCGAFVLHELWERKDVFNVQAFSFWGGSKDEGEGQDLKLKLVQIVFRHGARTPISRLPPSIEQATWSTDLVKDVPHTLIDYHVESLDGGPRPPSPVEDSYQKHGPHKGGARWGQLTSLGQQQMFDLGQQLRKHYIENHRFIDPEYNPQQVYVRSTNIKRTIESARCVLAGMFGNSQSGKEDPIRIYTSQVNKEIFWPNYVHCGHLGAFWKTAWGLLDTALPGYREDRLKLQRILGIEEARQFNIFGLRDELTARKAHGLPIPESLAALEDVVEQRATQCMAALVSGIEDGHSHALRLSTGPVIDLLTKNMLRAQNTDNCHKLHLYSGHDTTLIPLLKALGIFDDRWPPYAAHVTVEFYQDAKKNSFVKVLYIEEEKQVQGCSAVLCPFEEFQEAMATVALSHKTFWENCKIDQKKPSQTTSSV